VTPICGGANFTGATLIGANFSKSETGVQKRWVAFQLVISFFLSELAGIFVAYTGAWVTIFLPLAIFQALGSPLA
jgi:hypothetical protein